MKEINGKIFPDLMDSNQSKVVLETLRKIPEQIKSSVSEFFHMMEDASNGKVDFSMMTVEDLWTVMTDDFSENWIHDKKE